MGKGRTRGKCRTRAGGRCFSGGMFHVLRPSPLLSLANARQDGRLPRPGPLLVQHGRCFQPPTWVSCNGPLIWSTCKEAAAMFAYRSSWSVDQGAHLPRSIYVGLSNRKTCGCGSNLSHQETAGFSLCCHLPGFSFFVPIFDPQPCMGTEEWRYIKLVLQRTSYNTT